MPSAGRTPATGVCSSRRSSRSRSPRSRRRRHAGSSRRIRPERAGTVAAARVRPVAARTCFCRPRRAVARRGRRPPLPSRRTRPRRRRARTRTLRTVRRSRSVRRPRCCAATCGRPLQRRRRPAVRRATAPTGCYRCGPAQRCKRPVALWWRPWLVPPALLRGDHDASARINHRAGSKYQRGRTRHHSSWRC